MMITWYWILDVLIKEACLNITKYIYYIYAYTNTAGIESLGTPGKNLY